VKVVIGNGTWTTTLKECGEPVDTFGGTWTYNETTKVYTIKEEGEPDIHGTVANDTLTLDNDVVLTKTEHTVPCP